MAQSGEDVQLSRMLIEVAVDLEAEAEAIDAEVGHIGASAHVLCG